MPFDRAFPGVVGGGDQGPVTAKALLEPSQIGQPALDVGFGIEGMPHAETLLRARHQLHHALRIFRRDRQRIEIRLGQRDRQGDADIDAKARCVTADQVRYLSLCRRESRQIGIEVEVPRHQAGLEVSALVAERRAADAFIVVIDGIAMAEFRRQGEIGVGQFRIADKDRPLGENAADTKESLGAPHDSGIAIERQGQSRILPQAGSRFGRQSLFQRRHHSRRLLV